MSFHGTSGTTQPAVLDTVAIDRQSRVPHYRQLYHQLRTLLLRRTLRPGMRLPSTRALSSDLTVARNTVVAVYEQLATEGFIETSHGARAWVADLPTPVSDADRAALPPLFPRLSRRGRALVAQEHSWAPSQGMLFQPGMPEMQEFPFGTWRRLLTERIKPGSVDVFGYHSFGGHPPLREAIASYVEASRGVRCSADQVIVTSGAQGALNLLASLFIDPGDDVMLEEPGYTGAQGAFVSAGANLLPLRVSESGWCLEDLEKSRPRLIYLTPSCQFPMGITMRMEQRLRLLELARDAGAWTIEDDFDSEYRFSTKPIPAMQGVDDTGRTIYVGTFAKTLFPSLRIGFLVMPGAFDEKMTKALFLLGQTTPLFLQAALADFINEGHFSKHLRRMKRLYARRRSLFMELVPHYLGDWMEPLKGGAGLQTVWRLAQGIDDRVVAGEAAEASISTTPLSIHYRHGSSEHGLILGYASVDEEHTHLGLACLRATFEKMTKQTRPGVRSGPSEPVRSKGTTGRAKRIRPTSPRPAQTRTEGGGRNARTTRRS